MSLLHCSHCHEPISATHKQCPHCGRNISVFSDLKSQVENNRLWQVLLVILALLLLGLGWFWRMDGGSRWPLYILLVMVAPLVPWLLKLAYKNAAPVESGVECGEDRSDAQRGPKDSGSEPSGPGGPSGGKDGQRGGQA